MESNTHINVIKVDFYGSKQMGVGNGNTEINTYMHKLNQKHSYWD